MSWRLTFIVCMALVMGISAWSMPRSAYAASVTYYTTSSDGYVAETGSVYSEVWADTSASTLDAGGNYLYIGQDRETTTVQVNPEGVGSTTEITDVTCMSSYCIPEGVCPDPESENWQAVCPTVCAPGGNWRCEFITSQPGYKTDTYQTGDIAYTDEDTVITQVKIHTRSKGSSDHLKEAVRTHGTNYFGTEHTISTSGPDDFDDRSYTWTTNPYTTEAWTLEEVQAMEIGVSNDGAAVYWVYAEVSLYTYTTYRSAVYFDTSGLAPGTQITAATLEIYVTDDQSDTDFSIQIQNGMPAYPHDPLVAGDFNRQYYSGDGGTLDTTGGLSGWETVTLTEQGRNWINSGGVTKFILRSDEDINGSAPSGDEYVQVGSQEGTWAAKLNITYDPPGVPLSFACEAVSSTQVDLSWVAGSGATHTGVWVKVGSYPADRTDGVQIYFGTGTSYGYTSLVPNTSYYFRAWGYESYNETWSGSYSETYCTTLTGVPSNFLAIPLSADRIGLTWDKGDEYTGVYYKLGGYPGSRDDGTQVYYGTGESFTHSGLDAGTTYYYRAWGYHSGLETWSATYDQDMATTLLGEAGGPDAPPMPEEWFQDPSCSAYGSVPGYTLLIDLSDSMSMPYGTMCLMSTVFLVVGVSVVGLVLGGTMIGLSAMAVAILAASIAGLMPMWFLLVALVLGISLAFAWTRA